MPRRPNQNAMTDRERILINIASQLAVELASCQNLPGVREYMERSTMHHIKAEYAPFARDYQYQKGDLVACWTSSGRQQNPWLVSFVEQQGCKYDAQGLLLRAVGTNQLCEYSNESFITIKNIPDRLLWEGDKHQFARKLNQALNKLDSYGHRFRGVEFDKENSCLARVFIGEVFGGMGKPTKPYIIEISYTKRMSVKAIIAELEKQGFGTRKFEPMDESYDGPMEGLKTITRESLTSELSAAGFQLKESHNA